jgi:hypothetical protein
MLRSERISQFHGRPPLLKGKGFGIIHYLVRNQGEKISLNDLSQAWSEARIDFEMDPDRGTTKRRWLDAHATLSTHAMEKIKAEWTSLKQDLEEAKENNDISRVETLQKEVEAYEDYMLSSLKRNGTSRTFRNEIDKIRERTGKSIKRALEQIRQHDEEGYRHFVGALSPIHSYTLSYKPDRIIDWITS